MGFFSWWSELREARRRVLIEDALKHIHACAWEGGHATPQSMAGALGLSCRRAVRLCAAMQAQGLVCLTGTGVEATAEGMHLAIQVIRAHRLWERYLADEAGMPVAKIHAEADKREHDVNRREKSRLLDAAMGHPLTDPHGDPIPSDTGQLDRAQSRCLTDWPLGRPGTIVHVEDEPAVVLSQILAIGLRPGRRIRVIESTAQRMLLDDGQDTHVLAPVIACNIFVAPAVVDQKSGSARDDCVRLTALPPGASAVVDRLDEALRGFTRRRLLDLGLTRGARISTEYASFMGDPIAYRVRGTLIALRRQQAECVLVHADDPQLAGVTEGRSL